MRECGACGFVSEDGVESCPDDGRALAPSVSGSSRLDGRYRLDRKMAEGGMGTVYLATHVELARRVVVKLIRSRGEPSQEAIERFRREAKALGQLDHPNVVGVTDFGVDPRNGGTLYLVLEHLEGETIQSLTARGAVPADRALEILDGLAAGLDFAHSRGILHRDLKPENVLIDRAADGTLVPKILDFGLARFIASKDDAAGSRIPLTSTRGSHALESPLTDPDFVMGTPGFVAPELFEGAAASRSSDVYGLGILAFLLLVGEHPWKGASDLLRAARMLPLPLPSVRNPNLPREVDGPLLAPLVPEPERRPESGRALVGALRSAFDAATTSRREGVLQRWRPQLSTGLAILASLLAALLFATNAFESTERSLADARARFAPARAASGKVLLVSIDDASDEADATPLVHRADEMARLLEALFAAGARGAAIDLLIHRDWSASDSFSRAILTHRKKLVLAALSTDERVVGPEVLSGLTAAALDPEEIDRLFGFVNVVADADGAVRSMRLSFRDVAGHDRLSFTARGSALLGIDESAFSARRFVRLDPSFDPSTILRFSWKDATDQVTRNPALVRDRLVVIGAEFAGSGDLFEIVSTKQGRIETTGLVLHALAIESVTQDRPILDAQAGDRRVLLLAGISILVGVSAYPLSAAATKARELWVVALGMLLLAVGVIGLSFVLFRWGRILAPVTIPLVVWEIALFSGALFGRRVPRFALARFGGASS